MKIGRMFAPLVFLGGAALSGMPAKAEPYTVQSGDTLWKIAAKNGVSPSAVCRLNRIGNCNLIRPGQTLQLPSHSTREAPSYDRGAPDLDDRSTNKVESPSEVQENKKASSTEESLPVSKPAQSSPEGAWMIWKRVGANPVLKSWVRKLWLASDEVKLDPRQEASLRSQGLTEDQIVELRHMLAMKKHRLTFRPEGYEWRHSMGMGSGVWGKTRNGTGKDIPVFALPPTSDGYQVDLALGCGNPAVNRVQIFEYRAKEVVQTPEEKEKGHACEKVGAFWAQVTQHGVSGTARFACLFQVNDTWKAGPTVAFGGSRFDDRKWVEVQNFAGGGLEVRGKNVAGLDAVEFVVMVGYGSSEGRSADGLVKKLKSQGLDAQIAIQLRKQFSIEEGTSVTVRFMPFANIPLTGKETDILWKNTVVKQENGRHVTVGATLRLELQRSGLGFKPELTLGIWRISDVDNPIGWKILAGASTLDNVWRFGVGAQFPGPIWVVELEWNPAWGWLQLSSNKATTALTEGAVSTREALDLPPKKEESEERVSEKVVSPTMSREVVQVRTFVSEEVSDASHVTRVSPSPSPDESESLHFPSAIGFGDRD